MRTIYAIQLGVTPPAGQPASGSYTDLAGMICQWIEDAYKRKWATTVSLPVDGQTVTPLPNHSFRALASAADDSELFILDWTHPDDSDLSTAWMTSCIAARHGQCLQVSVILRISAMRTVLRPVRFDLGRPRIVNDILTAYQTTVDGWPVSTAVERIASPQVQGYVDNVLLNANRNLPVIMISPDTWHDQYSVVSDDVLDKLKGFAQVAVLADKWAAFKLTDVVEKPLSCYDGAVRIYWPGFKLDDHPFQHRLYFPESIRYHKGQGVPLHEHLFRMLAAVASYRHTEGSVIREARQAIARQETKKIDDLRDQVKAGHVEKSNLETQLLEALERISQLTEQLNTAKDDLAAQQAAFAESLQAVAAGTDAEGFGQQPEQEVEFKSVVEAVQRAKEVFSQSILFLESAIKLAEDSPFQSPELPYGLFEAMDELVKKWKGDGNIGCTWKEALEAKGFTYKPDISQTCKQKKYVDDYQFIYDGKKRIFGEHVTFGKGQDPQGCMSVHWYRDDKKKLLVVARCGKHGANSKT